MPTDSLFPVCVALLLLLPVGGALALQITTRRGAGWLAVTLTGVGLLLSGWLFGHLPAEPVLLRAAWITFPDFGLNASFRLDALTGLMLVLVHLVALLVQIYSLAYLHDETRQQRYFAYLQLFIGAMLGIVLAGNLLILYGFWELVGLASYLLIGFYTERPAAAKAAQKAFLMNRIGDAAFLIGILLTQHLLGTTEFTAFTAPLPTAVGLCLFMGCVAKSAQFPLLTWLPDAMEGPTPVSALLHAATMVAAGIFLLTRIFPLLSPDALTVITVVGTLTTVWGGYSALFQTDIKRVLAFSTVSQLGLMVTAVGTGNVAGAMFHLLTHAFFKAGLFLSAGNVIHAAHTQDMRQMGGLRKHLPATAVCYLIFSAALAGLPLFSGFLSKETILAGAFLWADNQGGIALSVPILLVLSSGLTALYMARQLWLVFFGQTRSAGLALEHRAVSLEPNWLMRGPVVLLAVLSVWGWFSLNPLDAATGWFFTFVLPNQLPETHFWWLAPVSVVVVLAGGWLGFYYGNSWLTVNKSNRWIRLSLEYGFLDTAYSRLVRAVRRLALSLNRTDQRLIDGVVVNGAGTATVVLAHVTYWLDRMGVDGLVNGGAWLAQWFGSRARAVQNGRVQSYITAAVVGLLVLIWLLV